MARGFLSGIFWGAVVGVAVLFVSSQTLDRQQMSLPQPEASAVEVPGGSEFDQARVETDPVLPEPESAPGAEGAAGLALPADDIDAPPAMDTSALEVPVPDPVQEAPSGLSGTPEEEEAPVEPEIAEDTAPAGNAGGLIAPEAPGSAPETAAAPATPEPEPEPAPEPAPEVVVESPAPETQPEVAALPETGDATDVPGASDAPEEIRQDEAPAAMPAPEISEEPSLPTGGGAGLIAAPSEPALPQITAPEVEAEPEIAEAPTEPQQPPEVKETGLAAAEPEQPREAEETEVAAVEPEAENTPGASTLQTDDSPSLLKPVEDITERSDDDGRLPSVLRVGEEEETETEVAASPGEEGEAAGGDQPALERFGTSFENPEGRPMLAIVLVHEGGAALGQDRLQAIPSNVAIAVDAARNDAADLAAAYRAMGREVVMIPALPAGAKPQDVEQALQANFDKIPQAVALMDASGSNFQSERNAVAQVVAVIGDTGHGLITYPRGLNTAHQEAGRAGVPAGLIFRDIDDGDATQDQVGRALDRAAFRARQDEAVILLGRTSDTTLAAIVEWSLGSRAESVTIAPVSAALLGG